MRESLACFCMALSLELCSFGIIAGGVEFVVTLTVFVILVLIVNPLLNPKTQSDLGSSRSLLKYTLRTPSILNFGLV